MPSDTADSGELADKTKYTAEQIKGLRDAVGEIMTVEGLNQADVARASGIAYGTFTAWFRGTYGGDVNRVAGDVRRWLNNRDAKKAMRATGPVVPGFLELPAAQQMFAILDHAQHAPDFATITGAPGVGKTQAVCAYKRARANVFKITAHPLLTSPRALIEEIQHELGVLASGGPHKRMAAIVRRLRTTGALIIIDESQHLESTALDQLRSIHDAAGIGVALVGNATTLARLEGGSRSAHFAQLHSRVGMRFRRDKPSKQDIDMLVDAWGVEGDAERKLLHAIGRKPGALRNITKTLRSAHMLAVAEGEAIAERHIAAAYARLSNTDQGETG